MYLFPTFFDIFSIINVNFAKYYYFVGFINTTITYKIALIIVLQPLYVSEYLSVSDKQLLIISLLAWFLIADK